MKLKDLKKDFIIKLSVTYQKEEVLSFFKILCEEYLNITPTKLLLVGEELINKEQLDMFSKVIIRLLNEEPIQYILNTTSFYGLDFISTPSALIPRPETEELVDWILKSEKNKISILDIGTGTGCIPISLAKNNTDYTVSALDISDVALELAKDNAQKNEVDISFISADIFSYTSDKKYDLIVSNPPYVRESEKKLMSKNVLDFEPELALFVDNDDPLVFYRAILKFANKNMQTNGKVYFEINEYLYNDMKELFLDYEYININFKIDFFGKNRFVSAIKS